jgi:hypothetical protein
MFRVRQASVGAKKGIKQAFYTCSNVKWKTWDPIQRTCLNTRKKTLKREDKKEENCSKITIKNRTVHVE